MKESLKNRLSSSDEFDILNILEISASQEKAFQIKSMREAIDQFESDSDDNAHTYLVRLRAKGGSGATSGAYEKTSMTREPSPSEKASLYSKDGNLNEEYLLRNAQILVESGEHTLARNIYKALLKTGGDTGKYFYLIGLSYESENRKEQAKRCFEESVAFRPSIDAYRRLSSILLERKKDQEAAEVMERALYIKSLSDQDRFELHQACGNSWTRVERYSKAEEHFKKALDVDPSSSVTQSNLGSLYLKQDRHSEAKSAFEDAIAADSQNEKAHIGIATVYLDENESKKAFDHFADALEIQIENPTAIFYLIKLAYETKSYSRAESILTRYVENSPVNANLLYSLAGLQFHLKKYDLAKRTAEKVLRMKPEHNGAQELIQRMNEEQGLIVTDDV